MKILTSLADNRKNHSLASTLRRKRFVLFQSLISTISRPIRILDVGGTASFWQAMDFDDEKGVDIVLLNVQQDPVVKSNIQSVVGDATNMKEFRDGEFDVVFSNSVIEHVGDLEAQKQMASEVRRVGKRCFVQTPNLFFPLEPHFLFPFFQFLPETLQVFLIRHFPLGFYGKVTNLEHATAAVRSIRLLALDELKTLFPGAQVYREKFCGLTKSFIVYDGWIERV